MEKAATRGKVDDPTAVLARVDYTSDLEDLRTSDAVIEAVVEDPRVKGKLFQRLDQTLPDAVFLASNTSSIPMAAIASWTRRPERVLGLHFFSPVPVMSLVEIVRAIDTSQESLDAPPDSHPPLASMQC